MAGYLKLNDGQYRIMWKDRTTGKMQRKYFASREEADRWEEQNIELLFGPD